MVRGQSLAAVPCLSPFIWDVPPVTVAQQPDSGEGTEYDYLAPPLYDNEPGLPRRWLAGCSAQAAHPPHPGAGGSPNDEGLQSPRISWGERPCRLNSSACRLQVERLSFCFLRQDKPQRSARSIRLIAVASKQTQSLPAIAYSNRLLQSETCAETDAETCGLCQSRHHSIFAWHPPPP